MPNIAQVYNRRHIRAIHSHKYGASVIYIYGSVVLGRYRRVRSASRAVINFRPVVTTNAHGSSGKVQPRATVRIPRRRYSRVSFSYALGTQSSSVPVSRIRVHRRRPARAVAGKGILVPHVIIVSGTVPLNLPVYRRKFYRAVHHGTIVRTTNNPLISGHPMPRSVQPVSRRISYRAVHHHVIALMNAHGPRGKAGPSRVYRRKSYRAVWLGTVVRTVNAPHPSQYRPHYVVRRRAGSRAIWRGIKSPFLYSRPVTGKGTVHRRKTSRSVILHVSSSFRYPEPVSGRIVYRRKSARSVVAYRIGSVRASYSYNSGRIYRRTRQKAVIRFTHGQVPLLRTYVTEGMVARSRSYSRRVNWNFTQGVTPEFIVCAFVAQDWSANINPIFYQPPVPPGQ
jgi:hypothetical protein